MKFIVAADEAGPTPDAAARILRDRGHAVALLGAPAGEVARWADIAHAAAGAVAAGEADQAVLFCWTGTGVSIAANKVPGIRAALCADAPTAAGARRWNDANVLCLSLRATTPALVAEIIDAWLSADVDEEERDQISRIERR